MRVADVAAVPAEHDQTEHQATKPGAKSLDNQFAALLAAAPAAIAGGAVDIASTSTQDAKALGDTARTPGTHAHVDESTTRAEASSTTATDAASRRAPHHDAASAADTASASATSTTTPVALAAAIETDTTLTDNAHHGAETPSVQASNGQRVQPRATERSTRTTQAAFASGGRATAATTTSTRPAAPTPSSGSPTQPTTIAAATTIRAHNDAATPTSARHADGSAPNPPVTTAAPQQSDHATSTSRPGVDAPAANAGAPGSTAAATTQVTPAAAPFAAPPSAAAAPTTLPGVASQLLNVITPIQATATGAHVVSVALFPESLGEVRVTVSVSDGQLFVRLAPSTPEAADAIRANLADLRSGLEESGTRATVVLADGSGTGASFSGGNDARSASPEPTTAAGPTGPGATTTPDQSGASSPTPVAPTSAGLLDLRL